MSLGASPETATTEGFTKIRQQWEAGGRTINGELAALSRAIGYRWRCLWPKLRKLEESRDIGKALDPDQEKAVFEAAARNRSRLIYPYLMTPAWTGIRADEARMLRVLQLDFEANLVIVGKSKSETGKGRGIPMSAALRLALQHHVSHPASDFGPLQPEWYVFPDCDRRRR